MGSLIEHFNIFLIVLVYLTGLKDLRTGSAVFAINNERTSAGFTNISDHPTHTQGAVKLSTKIREEHLIFHVFQFLIAAHQVTLYKSYDFLQLFM